LKKAVEKYHGTNITFISISIDMFKVLEKWKIIIKDKVLGSIQSFVDNYWNLNFLGLKNHRDSEIYFNSSKGEYCKNRCCKTIFCRVNKGAVIINQLIITAKHYFSVCYYKIIEFVFYSENQCYNS
jgi:hypothetical protein